MNQISRIGLGTVQFGLDYGISNRNGKLSNSASEILTHAIKSGIQTLDTAHGYGNAEEIIGNTNLADGFKIISKVPANVDANALNRLFSESLEKLKVQSIEGLLFHDFSTWENNKALALDMIRLKKRGKIAKWGFSLYHPSQLDKIIDLEFDLVQVPFNVFDQRFTEAFELLKSKGVEIHIRSAFLQGLFFLDSDRIISKFGLEVQQQVGRLNELANELEISLSSLLLNFPLSIEAINKVVIGVDGLESLTQNIEGLNAFEKVKAVATGLMEYSSKDENLILPFNWN